MTNEPVDIREALTARVDLLSRAVVLADDIERVAGRMTACLRAGGIVYACGNGGSATQAQHFAAELVGRFKMDRAALRAFALNDNPAVITSLANDYDFNDIFSRQIKGIAREGDCLLALSTSGESENVVRACRAAREHGMFVSGMTGAAGGAVVANCDITICVPDQDTARVQEVHLMAIHLLCQWIEADMFGPMQSQPTGRSDDAA